MAIKTCLHCQAEYSTRHPTRSKYCGLQCVGAAHKRQGPKPPRARPSAHVEHPLRMTWRGMKQRCLNPRSPHFPLYGGRGIAMCERWVESFEAFLADMGPRPTVKHSVDRRDNDGNYEPGNCRWATTEEQSFNRRSTKPVLAFGVTDSLAGHAKSKGLDPDVLYHRVNKMGMTPEDALSVPLRRAKRAPVTLPDAAGQGSPSVQMMAECTPEAIEPSMHALVYGRVRIWNKILSDTNEFNFHWSKSAWWKALWYPHRGQPALSSAWGVYAGSDGFTGPGDAELTHWMPIPADPKEQP